jgi:hypothetical protein
LHVPFSVLPFVKSWVGNRSPSIQFFQDMGSILRLARPAPSLYPLKSAGCQPGYGHTRQRYDAAANQQ